MTLVVMCMNCKKPVEVQVDPPKIINMTAVTFMVVQHPQQVMCQCGAIVTWSMAGITGGIQAVGAVVPKEAQESMIVHPSVGFN